MADLAWRLMSWSTKPAPPSDSDAPSIFTALREQLGLRLDVQKIPLDGSQRSLRGETCRELGLLRVS
jgi:uncharacterized protein DUF3738